MASEANAIYGLIGVVITAVVGLLAAGLGYLFNELRRQLAPSLSSRHANYEPAVRFRRGKRDQRGLGIRVQTLTTQRVCVGPDEKGPPQGGGRDRGDNYASQAIVDFCNRSGPFASRADFCCSLARRFPSRLAQSP